MYFGNYKRVIYLSQTMMKSSWKAAKRAAETLGLAFEQVHTGYGDLETSLRQKLDGNADGQENNHLLA